MKHLRLFLYASLLWPFTAFSQDEAEDKALSVDAELGALITSGNTESTTLRGSLDLKQDLEKWRLNYVADAIYKQDQIENEDGEEVEQETAEKYFASIQADYKLNQEQRGLFVFGSYESDKFSGYEYQSTISAGYTDRLLKTEKLSWNYSIGLGASFNRSEELFDENGALIAPSESEDYTIVRLSFDLQYDISENAKFTQTLASNIATDSQYNTQTKAESALTANLNDSFALRASFTVINNTDVPAGIEETDTQTGLALVYSL